MGIKIVVHGADFSQNSIGKSYFLPQLRNLTAFYLGNNPIKNLVIDEEDATLHSTQGGTVIHNGYVSFTAGTGTTDYVETPHIFMKKQHEATAIIVRKAITGAQPRAFFNAFNGGSSHAVPALFRTTLYACNEDKWQNNDLSSIEADVFQFVAFTAKNENGGSSVNAFVSSNGVLHKNLELTSTKVYSETEPILYGGNPYNSSYGHAGPADIAAVMYYDTVLTEDELADVYNYLKVLELNKFELAVV